MIFYIDILSSPLYMFALLSNKFIACAVVLIILNFIHVIFMGKSDGFILNRMLKMPNLNFGIFVILVSGVFATSAVVNKIKSTPANIDQVKQLVQAEATLHQAILLQGDKQGDLFVDKDKAELWIKNFRESIHKQSDVVYLDTYLDLAEKFNNLNIGVSGTLRWLRDNSIDEYREQVEMNLANQSIQQNQSPVAIDDAKVDEFSQKLDEVLN